MECLSIKLAEGRVSLRNGKRGVPPCMQMDGSIDYCGVNRKNNATPSAVTAVTRVVVVVALRWHLIEVCRH